jgi:hypothetical protein
LTKLLCTADAQRVFVDRSIQGVVSVRHDDRKSIEEGRTRHAMTAAAGGLFGAMRRLIRPQSNSNRTQRPSAAF